MKKLKMLLITVGLMGSLSFVNCYAMDGFNNNNNDNNNQPGMFFMDNNQIIGNMFYINQNLANEVYNRNQIIGNMFYINRNLINDNYNRELIYMRQMEDKDREYDELHERYISESEEKNNQMLELAQESIQKEMELLSRVARLEEKKIELTTALNEVILDKRILEEMYKNELEKNRMKEANRKKNKIKEDELNESNKNIALKLQKFDHKKELKALENKIINKDLLIDYLSQQLKECELTINERDKMYKELAENFDARIKLAVKDNDKAIEKYKKRFEKDRELLQQEYENYIKYLQGEENENYQIYPQKDHERIIKCEAFENGFNQEYNNLNRNYEDLRKNYIMLQKENEMLNEKLREKDVAEEKDLENRDLAGFNFKRNKNIKLKEKGVEQEEKGLENIYFVDSNKKENEMLNEKLREKDAAEEKDLENRDLADFDFKRNKN